MLIRQETLNDYKEVYELITERVNDLLKDLTTFSKTEGKRDILIKAALSYYQFETIHPFECGIVMPLGKSASVLISLCDYLEQKLIISVQESADFLSVSYNTATKYVKIMEELEILKQVNEQSRYRIFFMTGM